MEAECYQKIGKIYEKINDLPRSIEFFHKFLELCEETGDKGKAGEAHKQLADAYSKNNNVQSAIKHLEDLLNIANELKNKPA
jgi:tetratricopeptide (TPR) repeat protein